MEQNSPVEILEDQIRECFGRVVWSHKTHEKCADILQEQFSKIKNLQIALSVIIATGVFYTIFGYNQVVVVVMSLLSAFLFGLNMYARNKNYGGLAEKHAYAAKELWNIRESYFSLLADIRTGALTVNQIMKQRDTLQRDLNNVYKGSSRTFFQAYKKASVALKENEELTFSDEEIDNFLPQKLRKKK